MPIRAALALPVFLLLIAPQAGASPAIGATPAAAPSSAAQLSESLGLRVAPHPVRERPGWRPPRIILIADDLHDLVPQLQKAAPGAKLIELRKATPREIADADATLGVCSAEVLGAAQHLQWIQWLGAGVERCVREPLLRTRAPLLTNLQRTMGPSMSEHVLALMFALSRHLDYFYRQQLEAHWAKTDPATPELTDLEGKTVLVAGLGRHRHRGRTARACARDARHRHPRERPRGTGLRELRGSAR